MNTEDLRKRINQRLREEKTQPHCPWFFSFATDKGFHAGMIVQCRGITDGLSICHRLAEISSNTSVRAFKIPGSAYQIPDEKYFYHRLKIEEVQEFWPDMKVPSGMTDYEAK